MVEQFATKADDDSSEDELADSLAANGSIFTLPLDHHGNNNKKNKKGDDNQTAATTTAVVGDDDSVDPVAQMAAAIGLNPDDPADLAVAEMKREELEFKVKARQITR